MLVNKPEDILQIIDHDEEMLPVLVKLVSYEHGIKLIKLFKHLYEKYALKHERLMVAAVLRGLEAGLGFEEGGNKVELEVDSVAQMRYLEIIVNILLAHDVPVYLAGHIHA